jgi:hypothetical protein
MHNNNSKKITPLSKFPTEVILHFYRKNRLCYTDHYKYIENYNHKTNKREFWIPFYGPFEKDGVIYNHVCLGYTKSTGEECHKKFTTVKSKLDCPWNEDGYKEWQCGDEVNFRFEGMYWEGRINQIKDELNKREHIGIFNNKDYRKWLIKYRKNKEII